MAASPYGPGDWTNGVVVPCSTREQTWTTGVERPGYQRPILVHGTLKRKD